MNAFLKLFATNPKEIKETYYPLKRKEEIIDAEFIEEISEINF